MRRKSFTLIEILITITIVILFSGITLAYYNNFTEDQKLKSESKRLISVLALARKSASAGVSDPADCSIFDGYKVVISETNYILQRCCSSCVIINNNYVCTQDCTNNVQTYNFDKNIKVKTGIDILFQPLSLGAKTTPPDQNIITIKNSLKCIDITIGLSTFDESGIKDSGC